MRTLVLGIATGATIGLVAVGIVLVYKATRVLNFAQAEFATGAAYLSWYVTAERELPWGVGWVVAIAGIVGLALAFERVIMRRMGDANQVVRSVATVGLLFLIAALELNIWGASPRLLRSPIPGSGITLFGFVLTPLRLIAIGALVVLAVGLGLLVSRTRFGLALLAVAEDPSTARLMGVPYHRVAASTWAVGGGLGALAGLLSGPLQGAIAPFGLTTDLFVPGLTAALLGGLTSLPGAFVGAIAIGVLQTVLKTQFGDVIGISSYGMLVVILLVLLVRPRGLFGRAA